jgi:hypothetical protein
MRLATAIVMLLSAAGSAAASGGLSCDVEDEDVRVAVQSGVTRGMGSPIFQFKGTLEILDKAVTEDLRKTEFEGAHVAQYWLDEQGLRLLLYRERAGDKPHGYVELTILTQAGDDEGLYGGSYKLSVFDYATGKDQSWNFEAPISCFVE